MLSLDDVARIFEVDPATIRRWYEHGEIRASRASRDGVLRFLREDVAIAYLTRSIRKCLEE